MTPYDHQEELSDLALSVIRDYGIVYLAMEERTGKTLTGILVAEKSSATKVLVITKRKAFDGWAKTLKEFEHECVYMLTTFNQAYKYKGQYNLAIIDEAHNYISGYPKTKSIWAQINSVVHGLPIIYMSATPHAQGPQQLFNQFALSDWSPWKKYKNFYAWFRDFGKPYTVKITGVERAQYDRCKVEKVMNSVKHLFITRTRKELGFEHEPVDKVHYIELNKPTREVYNTLIEDFIVDIGDHTLVCDTEPKLRYTLHMLEGGVAKVDEECIVLNNDEKVQYILSTFGDTTDTVIMYNYKAELTKLSKYFSNAILLQATSYAEGIDLSMHDNLVIYSQDFSTARHTQRRARQCNINRDTPITVHHLLVKKATSHQVYKTVAVNKKNFVDSVFTRDKL